MKEIFPTEPRVNLHYCAKKQRQLCPNRLNEYVILSKMLGQQEIKFLKSLCILTLFIINLLFINIFIINIYSAM